MVRFLQFEPIQTRRVFLVFLLVSAWDTGALFASGGYDHGTSTGKGKLELDFTWNPFNLLDQGQSYVVFGYGLTQRLDFHGYYAHPAEGNDNFYTGLFYQFLELKRLDLATAIGIRQYVGSAEWHVFAPQLLYNFELGRGFTLGGSAVTLRKGGRNSKTLGTTASVAIFIPFTRYVSGVRWIEDIKLGLGAFRPVLWKPKDGNWYPTYSVDVKFILTRKYEE